MLQVIDMWFGPVVGKNTAFIVEIATTLSKMLFITAILIVLKVVNTN